MSTDRVSQNTSTASDPVVEVFWVFDAWILRSAYYKVYGGFGSFKYQIIFNQDILTSIAF